MKRVRACGHPQLGPRDQVPVCGQPRGGSAEDPVFSPGFTENHHLSQQPPLIVFIILLLGYDWTSRPLKTVFEGFHKSLGKIYLVN